MVRDRAPLHRSPHFHRGAGSDQPAAGRPRTERMVLPERGEIDHVLRRDPGWKSVRKIKDGPTTDDLYGFLTTDPNAIVAPIHKDAMPVLLLTEEEVDVWMRGIMPSFKWRRSKSSASGKAVARNREELETIARELGRISEAFAYKMP